MSAAVFGFEYMHVGEEHTSHVMSDCLFASSLFKLLFNKPAHANELALSGHRNFLLHF